MKDMITVKNAFILIAAVLLPITMVIARQSGPAKEVLDQVSKKYQAYKTVSVAFSFTAVNKQNAKVAGDRGTLLLNMPEKKYRVSMEDQEIVSDGKTQWHILKELDEIQISDAGEDPGTLTPVNVFTFYKSGFDFNLQKDEKVAGKMLYSIKLTPTDRRRPYSFITLRVDKATKLIYDVTVFDKNGGRYSYIIDRLDSNKPVSQTAFNFDKSKYAGMEMVDLR